MLGKSLSTLLRRTANPMVHVPKRNWAQVGLAIATPPRIRCSYAEMLLHTAFMYTVWLAPMAYFLTQIKVWRREYIQN